VGLLVDVLKHRQPCDRTESEIEEALDDGEVFHEIIVGDDILTDLARRVLGLLAADHQQREDDQRHVTLKLRPRLLHLNEIQGHVLTIKALHGLNRRLSDNFIQFHNLLINRLPKKRNDGAKVAIFSRISRSTAIYLHLAWPNGKI